MAKTRGADAKLSRLRALRGEEATPEVVAELRKLLGDSSNLVAADAAEIVGNKTLRELAADLAAAFERFMIEPETSDKLCRAKTAIVEALNKIEYEGEDVFLRGIRHVQMEPVWGGSQDSAGQLRGSSAFGLVRIRYPHVLLLLVDLLADEDKNSRLAAVQAVAESGAPAAVALLRFKARTGDKDPEVIAECLSGLMNLAPVESLPFVTEFLHSLDASIQEGAALALGESRRPEAFVILKDFWPETSRGPLQEVILLAISMSRLPAALDFLVEIIGRESQAAALAALSALAIHKHNESLRARVLAAVTEKRDAALQTRFGQKFQV